MRVCFFAIVLIADRAQDYNFAAASLDAAYKAQRQKKTMTFNLHAAPEDRERPTSCIVINCFFLAFLVSFNLEHENVFTDDHTRIKKVDIEFLGCCDIFLQVLFMFSFCQVRVSAFLPSYYR